MKPGDEMLRDHAHLALSRVDMDDEHDDRERVELAMNVVADRIDGAWLTDLSVLSDGTQGIARGVDERGALLVHTSQGLRTVSSAEVSVRPTSST